MIVNRETINKKLAMRLLWDCLSAMGSKYILFLLVILAVAVVGLAPPQLYRIFFQSIQDDSHREINKLFFFGSMIAVCTFIATALSISVREWLRCEIEGALRKKVLSALALTSLEQLEKVNRGEWIACTSDDLIQTEDFLTMSLPDQIRNILVFIGSSALFLYYGGIYGAILLALALGLIFLNVTIQKKMRPSFSEIRGLQSQIYQQLLESFEGLRTIRSFGGQDSVQQNFSEKIRVINKKCISTMTQFSYLIGGNEWIILLGTTSILSLIIYNLNNKTLSLDDAMIYPFYLGIFFSSVASFYRSYFDWTTFFTRGAKLAHLIYGFRDASEQEQALVSPHIDSSRLSFSNIELQYVGHELLVPKFDLSLKKHDLLGIVGPSGCGKSTLLEFLAGLRPLVVDGKKTMLSTSLTSYVEQKPYIFEGSLADNLRFGCNLKVTDEQIWAVLEKSRLAQFFYAKNGLDFYIRERGENLSEGEKYRIGIARAILSNKPFLLMDEPFAALDEVSINAIIDLIMSQRANRGVVVVTHYLPERLIFDKIIDMSPATFEDFKKPAQIHDLDHARP